MLNYGWRSYSFNNMRKIFKYKIYICLIILSPFMVGVANASSNYFSSTVKNLGIVPRENNSQIKGVQDINVGSFLPGVIDNKILSFSEISSQANVEIKTNIEQRKREEQKRLQVALIEPTFDGKYIDIDLKTQTMTAFENRMAVHRFKISSGSRRTPTPPGTYSILNKIPRAYSRKYNLYMPWWMGFRWDGFGIHELPEWKNGVKEGQRNLGYAVSHGCVRLGVGPAKAIYDWANVGDKVYVH